MSQTAIPGTSPWRAHAFHLMAKPTGAKCNLDCHYCFFLEKESLYPGSRFRMTEEVQESYIRQTLESQSAPEATITWQGGEPTLMGLPFFRRAIALARRYARPDQRVNHQIQTNGTLLNDEWCGFLRENGVLVGISMDGPRAMHDAYRVDKQGRATFDSVMRGIRLLQKHGVDYNVLATLHAANQDHPVEVYRFFRDEVGTDWIQFIPIVERARTGGVDGVTDRSVAPEKYGAFLIGVFDEWIRRDVGRVFVQDFEVALRCWMGLPATLCIHSPTCGDALALEHNGDVYSCDHFVSPEYLLGNLTQTPLLQIVTSGRQHAFGLAKRDALPPKCLSCDVRFACHGGCPKDRFAARPGDDPALNYLCPGYLAYFRHIDRPMRLLADLLDGGRPAEDVMEILARERADAAASVGRNEPCPCGSGRKFKKCCAGKAV